MHYCRSCSTQKLVQSRYRWYEWPMALLLLRPYKCPHCFGRTIRFLFGILPR